jgi:hypothetical protein
MKPMKRLSLAVAVLLAGCGTQSESERMKDACDARVCPSNPPALGIDCMPIVPEEWLPVCSASCRTFLHDTCKIEFSD